MKECKALELHPSLVVAFDPQIKAPPDAEKHVAIRKDPDVEVWCENVVESSDLLVSEESVRHPHLARVRQGQVLDPLWKNCIWLDYYSMNALRGGFNNPSHGNCPLRTLLQESRTGMWNNDDLCRKHAPEHSCLKAVSVLNVILKLSSNINWKSIASAEWLQIWLWHRSLTCHDLGQLLLVHQPLVVPLLPHRDLEAVLLPIISIGWIGSQSFLTFWYFTIISIGWFLNSYKFSNVRALSNKNRAVFVFIWSNSSIF